MSMERAGVSYSPDYDNEIKENAKLRRNLKEIDNKLGKIVFRKFGN